MSDDCSQAVEILEERLKVVRTLDAKVKTLQKEYENGLRDETNTLGLFIADLRERCFDLKGDLKKINEGLSWIARFDERYLDKGIEIIGYFNRYCN